MKKIYLSALMLGVFALVLLSCQKQDRKAEGEIIKTSPVLNMAQSNVWLRDSNETITDKFLLRINWTKARFTYENGLPAEVDSLRYVLEMDIADFSNPVVLAQTPLPYSDLFLTPLYQALLTWCGGEPDLSQYVSFRIKTLYGKSPDTLFSNTLVLRVDPKKPLPDTIITPTIPEVNIRFKQTVGTWTRFFIYSWSTGTTGNIEEFGSWPGTELFIEDGWFAFTVPASRPIHIILNNGSGSQWDDFFTDPSEEDEGDYEIDTDAKTKIIVNG
ncbi:MAG: starch-binding protein [Bacteroidales bacterium]|jgi:hypothetical protein|nr:starch-binding protein [Bacteroidales bacterium]